MVIYRCGYIVMYSTVTIGKFRYIIIIIYEVPTKQCNVEKKTEGLHFKTGASLRLGPGNDSSRAELDKTLQMNTNILTTLKCTSTKII